MRIGIRQCLALTIFCLNSVLSDNTGVTQGSVIQVEDDEDNREGKYMSESWHVVQTIPEGATGWIPRDTQAAVAVKRRRLRKRKRRPPVVSYLDQSIENDPEQLTSKADVRPTANSRYDSGKVQYGMKNNGGDPWVELSEENIRPYIRRKVTPAYQSQEDEDIGITNNEGSNLNPLSASIQFGPAETDIGQTNKNVQKTIIDDASLTTKKPQNLKEILKQNGGLSLSEILQKKNITLGELLMGNQQAIEALTESSEPTTTTQKNLEQAKYKRVPPSVALRKQNINRKHETAESLSSTETMEAQRKRLSLLQGHKHTGKFGELTRNEMITETTTEKQIPSSGATSSTPPEPANSGIQDAPSTIQAEDEKKEATERVTTSTASTNPLKTAINKRLPLTSAKIIKLATKKPTTRTKLTSTMETIVVEDENYPKLNETIIKPIIINDKEVWVHPATDNDTNEKVTDGPLHMSIDLDDLEINPTPKLTTVTSPSTTTQETTKLPPRTARDEILQLLKDPRGRAGLARILEQRNMTIQELIEQRERGSSQLHLADIFHNNTREPEPVEEPLEGKVSSEVINNFPVFMRHPKELVIDENSTKKEVQEPTFPSFKIPSNFSEGPKNEELMPWHQLYPELFNKINQFEETETKNIVKLEPADILTEQDLRLIEEVDQTLYASASNEEMNIVDETSRRLINISPGVKSAIVASLAIIVLSMIVFVTILVIFRWTQRKKKHVRYNNDSLKPSLISSRHKNIKTFMAETLGKKKVNYYKRHLQSMSDNDSWERESKRTNVY